MKLWQSFLAYESVQDMPPPRELPVALAHCLVKAKPGTDRMELLNRIFCGLCTPRAIQCRAELARCRRHIANPQEAQIT
jgi:hypothetical protein